MSYLFELRRREATAIEERRRRAHPTSLDTAGFPPPDRPCAQAATPEPPPGAPVDRMPENTIALAISGGGIRCATFALGILQALAKKKRLRSIDIMSTVSGGGYIGSFLGRLFTRSAIRDHQLDPCGRVEEILADNNSPQVEWLRTHGNYIISQGGSDVREHLAVFWRNLASIYFILAMLGAAGFGLARMAGDKVGHWLPAPGLLAARWPDLARALSPWWWLPLAVLALAIIPGSIAYWLAPKPGTRASFSFFPLTGWIVLLAGLAAGLALGGGTGLFLAAGLVVLLAIFWMESARAHLPVHLDRSTGETSADPGTVIRRRLTVGLGEALVVLFACIIWVVVDTVSRGLAQGSLVRIIAAWGALLMPIAPFFRKWATLLGSGGAPKEGGGLFSSPGFRAGLIAFPLAGFLLVVVDGGVHALFNHNPTWGLVATLLAIAISLVFGRAFDFLNYSALQQSYGSRLSRTFLGASNPARFRAAAHEEGNDVQVSHPDDDLEFDEYHPEKSGGPLHLIGLCVNETVDAASQRDIRDRKGLPMCVSPCGVSVGRRFHAVWSRPPAKLPVRAWLRRLVDGRGPVDMECANALRAIPVAGDLFHVLKGKTEAPIAAEPLRFGTWIALSGAAFGTGTGRTTSLPLALLLGLVNVRLGYWWDSGLTRTERPGQYPANLWRRLPNLAAALVKMQSLLLSDFKGRFPGPGHRFWNISDGGHFDVTGIYELLRRRVPFILAIDGGQDPDLIFADAADLTRQARIDLGANIEFIDDPAAALKDTNFPKFISEWIRPEALGKLADIGKKDGRHCTLAKVTYDQPKDRVTWIVLLKASLTGDEPLDIAAYKKSHATFPGETTADQFFDEGQWESYRMLGEHIGNAALTPAPK